MADWLRVAPEDLDLAAATVDMHADDLRTKHGEADGRVEQSIAGLPAGAAAALGAKVAEWQATTSAIYGTMAGHSQGLRTGATAYAQTDEKSAATVEKAGEQILDLGL